MHPTLHVPACADAAASTSCFTPVSIDDEPLLAAASTDEAFHHTPGTIWQDSCFMDNPMHASTEDLVPRCLRPPRGVNGGPTRALFLVGDSHAAMSVNGLRRAVEGAFAFAWATVGHNCALDRDGGYKSDDYGIDCAHWTVQVMGELAAEVRARDVVVYRLSVDHYRQHTFEFVRSALHPLVARNGAKLVLVGDSPKLRTRATYCLPSRFAPRALERCDTPRSAAGSTQVDAALQAFADEHEDVAFFGLFDLFCEATRCRATIPGTNTFWIFDEHHFTVAGGMYLWPFWCSFFASNNWFR